MRTYSPRRASARWLDGDCPKGVLAIFDDRKSGDRYTVFYAEPVCGTDRVNMYLSYFGASALPFHPQGIGMHGEMRAHEVAAYRYANKHHACKWSNLPPDVQKVVRQDCAA